MVAYESKDVFPRPLPAVWEFLQAHLDDERVRSIHPLILRQSTVRREGTSVVVERSIDVRGKPKTSTWKITYEPPRSARWEIVESAGPWTQGSWLENHYSEAAGGTQIETHGDLTIQGLPFFLSQKKWVHKVLDDIDAQDRAFLGPA